VTSERLRKPITVYPPSLGAGFDGFGVPTPRLDIPAING